MGGDYRLDGPKPARLYEVILPKKINYFAKIQQVLEDLFDEDAIKEVPSIRRRIREAQSRNPSFDSEGWVRTLCEASRGYSIYEMDGRYLSASGPIDERVLVFRFIFHNPSEPGMVKGDFLAASLEVIHHLVAVRFAEELGVEEEIWLLEFGEPKLAIWKKQQNPASSQPSSDRTIQT